MYPAVDHLVIAVPDLPAAVRRYRDELGFVVGAGGRHPGKGTRNALIALDGCYLELITVADPAEARRAGRGELVRFLAGGGSGLVAYALATADLDAAVGRLARAGVAVTGPFPMRREGGDGRAVRWRLAVPFGNQYLVWWPFLIQWQDPGRDWPGAGPAPSHPNGVRGLAELWVESTDVAGARAFFTALGVPEVDGRYRIGTTDLVLGPLPDAGYLDLGGIGVIGPRRAEPTVT
ncbi:VOC family protein [Pseudonocardia acaciae]|uniref:VOC family protein n=1 Tax=Pseudonocardia acaciae TaxID=551276 RepID=UPI00146FDBCC|nr:VOC family protein [Pseudonocardia acaciae]